MSVESSPSQGNASSTERDESLKFQRAFFLAGIFEAAGTVSVEETRFKKTFPSGLHKYRYAYPLLSFSDSRIQKIKRFKEIFGGHLSRDKKKSRSRKWFEKGDQAVEIAHEIFPYSPSRAERLAAVINWGNADSVEDKLSIALALKENKTGIRLTVPVEAYDKLVTNPSFMAGIFQARGAITEKDNKVLYITITSTNTALLEAIKRHYHAGGITEGSALGRMLSISRTTADRVLSDIAPHLLMPLEEYRKAS